MSPYYITAFVLFSLCVPVTGHAGEKLRVGDDSSEFAHDGECDDPRFTGKGMAGTLLTSDIGRDASDCLGLYHTGKIKLRRNWRVKNPVECASVDWGDNRSEYANDSECDDPRFKGPGVDSITLLEDLKHDANDCRRMCTFQQLSWRKK